MDTPVHYENGTYSPSMAGTVEIPWGFYRPGKVVIEWFAAAMLLLIAAPIIGALALIVKRATPGPAFYSQVRLGRNGRPFRIYKLRTMINKCEEHTGPVWSCANDPRVTRLGRFLRDTHLDELPQLWNVVRGEMALIGPRPERPEIAHRIANTLPEFHLRLLIRPGITGLAQLRWSPNNMMTQVSQKLTNDLYYIRNLSLLMDVRICMATVFEIIPAGRSIGSRFLSKLNEPEQLQTSSAQAQEQYAEPYVELASAA